MEILRPGESREIQSHNISAAGDGFILVVETKPAGKRTRACLPTTGSHEPRAEFANWFGRHSCARRSHYEPPARRNTGASRGGFDGGSGESPHPRLLSAGCGEGCGFV